jgi:flagellar biosynthesis GTPase FlhF
MLKLHVKTTGLIMHKKYVCFFLCFAVAQISLPMQQLARPALTQASATIATIAPQLTNASRNCATNSSKPETSAPKNENQGDVTSNKFQNEKLEELVKELLEEQREQKKLLENIKNLNNELFQEQIAQERLLKDTSALLFLISFFTFVFVATK